MKLFFRLLRYCIYLGLFGIVLGIGAIALAWAVISPRLPDVQGLREVRLQEPLRIYSADGALMAVIGELRRTPVLIEEVPDVVRQAFIAVEDARFYEHPGFDWQGIVRAVWLLSRSGGGRVPGGSTITQQVARNFFLSTDYDYLRKVTEIFLAIKIEQELSKDQILELYLNKIFFGHRAYGIAAAANVYYGKTLAELTLAEAAMLASLPKAPSTRNPITNRTLAVQRRNYVLSRMRDVGFIDLATYTLAAQEPDRAHLHEPQIELDAPYVAELARQEAAEILGADAFTGGHHLHTTVDSRLQRAATDALRRTLMDYDLRHGYRGPEARVELGEKDTHLEWSRHLSGLRPVAGLIPALVIETSAEHALLHLSDGQLVELDLAAVRWARPYINENRRGPAPKGVDEVLALGDVVRVRRAPEGEWQLSQFPDVQGALASIDVENGAIVALEGGFSYARSRFNRATQSARQPGSSFKPFVYSAAFERGLTPATVMLDGPIVYDDASLERAWRPSNDNMRYDGLMRLREAMVTSRNTVSVRVLQETGLNWAHEYMTRFGFPADSLPQNLSLALGTSALPPLAMARGFAVFGNGGYLVDTHLVTRIEDPKGKIVHQFRAPLACNRCPERLYASPALAPVESTAIAWNGSDETAAADAETETVELGPPLAPQVIDERNAYMITSLLQDVVRRGTGRAALSIGRRDLGGKTGTTNDFRDVWFSGFNHRYATSVWVGFDNYTPLGSGEFASRAALPMWIDYMAVALEGVEEQSLIMPEGITSSRINPRTGELARPGEPGAILEMFRIEDLQRLQASHSLEPERNGESRELDIF